MISTLTNRSFWSNYWNKKSVNHVITRKFSFYKLFTKYLKDKKYNSIIEIGGFPGDFAIYFSKYFGYESTILDFVIKPRVLDKKLKANGLPKGKIRVINANFLEYKPKSKYDVVFSLGFVEHFENFGEIIKKHWDLVANNGTLIVGIPNFLGINGIYQLLFDPHNLNMHNLDSMSDKNLELLASSLKPKKYHIEYVSGALVWLEDLIHRKFIIRLLTQSLNLLGMFLTKIGVKNKCVSTHIFLIMEK